MNNDKYLIRRVLLALTGFSITGIGFTTWGSIVSVPVVGALSILLSLCGIVLTILAFVGKEIQFLRRIEVLALLIGILSVVMWSLNQLYFSPVYGTDEVAFEQYSAQLLTQGVNPYSADLMNALQLFRVPIQYATSLMNGGVSSQLAYPDLSFLFIVPLLKMGISTQAALIVNVFFYVTSMVIAYFLMPKEYRQIALILYVGIPTLFGYTVAGLNSCIFTPFLVFSAFRWTNYEKGKWLAPIMYGLACSVQQLPWFIAPFLITGIFMEAKKRSDSSREGLQTAIWYTGIAIGTFLIVNVPFILWNPKTWLEGIFRPLLQHAIPYGQGIVGLSAFFGIGGGHISFYTDASLLLIAAFYVTYIFYYGKMRYVTFFLPAFFLFFASRSLAEYFFNLILCGMIGAFTVDTSYEHEPINKKTKKMIGLSYTPSLIVLLLAIFIPAPLLIQVTGFHTDGELEGVQQVQLRLTNTSNKVLEPHFSTNFIGQMSTFWNIMDGPKEIQPHQTENYTITAPNLGSMPPVTSAFQVNVVTPKPETLSISNRIILDKMTTSIVPSYINRPVKTGSVVHLNVELLNHYGSRIHKSGVPIALNQVIYEQNALIPAEGVINGANIGQSQVVSTTDAQGIAHFTIKQSPKQKHTVYYEAWIADPGAYPYGYSGIMAVNWD